MEYEVINVELEEDVINDQHAVMTFEAIVDFRGDRFEFSIPFLEGTETDLERWRSLLPEYLNSDLVAQYIDDHIHYLLTFRVALEEADTSRSWENYKNYLVGSMRGTRAFNLKEARSE